MAAVAFASPELFERSLIRTSLGAAGGGLLAGFASLAGASSLTPALVIAGALAALGTRRSWLPLGLLGLLAGAMVVLGTAYPAFYTAAAGAVAGAAIALSRYMAGEGERQVSWLRLGMVAVAGAAALLIGSETIANFASHGIFSGVPVPLAFGAQGALTGFFFGLSAASLHVQTGTDAVEALYGQVEGDVTGELARLSAQAIDLYRRCKEALTRSPQSAARAHVGKSLAEVTSRALELARKWHGVDLELGDRAEGNVDKRLTEVRALIGSATDATARRQLQIAEKALTEELTQIQRIRAGRERVVARLHADLAILERTRFALLALRSTDAHLMATELSHLSENLSALGREMDVEAQAIDEALRSATSSAPTLTTPVAPVASADPALEPVPAPAPVKEPERAG